MDSLPDRLDFDPHALEEMARDNIPIDAVYHVIGDADDIIEQDNGRTRYTGTWEGRTIVVIAEGDYVITAWERKRDSRRARRRRRQ